MAQVERLISMTAMSVISGPISHGRLKPRSSRESAKGRAALGEGIKLGDQGNFHRDQGMPLSSAIWPLPGDNPKSRLTISQVCRRKKLVCRARGGSELSGPWRKGMRTLGPRVCSEVGAPGRRADTTHLAIVRPGTPIVSRRRARASDFRMPGAPLAWTKAASSLR